MAQLLWTACASFAGQTRSAWIPGTLFAIVDYPLAEIERARGALIAVRPFGFALEDSVAISSGHYDRGRVGRRCLDHLFHHREEEPCEGSMQTHRHSFDNSITSTAHGAMHA